MSVGLEDTDDILEDLKQALQVTETQVGFHVQVCCSS